MDMLCHDFVGEQGERIQEVEFSIVHDLKGRLAVGCVPVLSMDGLKHYFYALTAHFGKWKTADGKKPVWELLGEFLYGQVIQHQRVDGGGSGKVGMMGEEKQYQERLKIAGLREGATPLLSKESIFPLITWGFKRPIASKTRGFHLLKLPLDIRKNRPIITNRNY